MEITNVSGSTSWNNNIGFAPTYTCEKKYPDGFVSSLTTPDGIKHDVTYNVDQTVPTTVAANYYDLTWANLPVNVDSTVETWSVDASGANLNLMGSCSAVASYWPDCVASVNTPSIDFAIVNGTSIDTNKLSLASSFTDSVGNHCPGFSGQMNLYRNDVKIQSTVISDDDFSTSGNLHVKSSVDAGVSKTADLAFNDGEWCVEVEMNADAGKPNEDPISLTSRKTCVDVVAPPCEMSAANIYYQLE